jgi:hypothetical protein
MGVFQKRVACSRFDIYVFISMIFTPRMALIRVRITIYDNQHGHAGQLLLGPRAYGPNANLCMLCMACFVNALILLEVPIQ